MQSKLEGAKQKMAMDHTKQRQGKLKKAAQGKSCRSVA